MNSLCNSINNLIIAVAILIITYSHIVVLQMSMASLQGMLAVTAAVLNEQLKAKCHLMEVTFLILLSFHHITLDAVECACVLACHLHTEYFTDELQVGLV